MGCLLDVMQWGTGMLALGMDSISSTARQGSIIGNGQLVVRITDQVWRSTSQKKEGDPGVILSGLHQFSNSPLGQGHFSSFLFFCPLFRKSKEGLAST